MTGDDDDARLVAFIDGRLDESARGAVEARLAGDADLRERLARLRDGGRPFAPAFQSLLDEAPVERLNAFLAALDGGEHESASFRALSAFRANRFAAAAAIILFCAGIAVGRFGPSWSTASPEIAAPASGQHEDWRQAVAEYMSLYTPDTFAAKTASQPDELSALGAKIGLALTPERIALTSLQFRGAQIFSYDGAPLGQLGYIDPATGPVLFCIIRDSEPDAAMKAEKRGGFTVSSWARAGHGYMLIGRLPVDQMAELANSLERRF
ncbi:anti-sigma factor [Methylocapsa sp. S129]|uniref:anti-sigma factor family protein n=1 Tax=Methylocapsa sp. S129 TaxID=1641869 RepID=UPI00131E44BB|nr:anti-sigma factor [Methylocapsa sp. S129]